jgi:hypothetical protein
MQREMVQQMKQPAEAVLWLLQGNPADEAMDFIPKTH